MRMKQNQCSYYMLHSFPLGPIFGGGNFGGGSDFCIYSDANKNINSYYNIGVAYELIPGYTNKFLVGSKFFKVSDIEVL